MPSQPVLPAREVRMAKSATAYRSIREVAAELHVAPHVLRFWESKFKQVQPVKGEGGRRFYRPEDVALLREIKHLLYTEGYTVRGVQTHLNKGAVHTTETTEALLEHRQILAELKSIRAVLQRVTATE